MNLRVLNYRLVAVKLLWRIAQSSESQVNKSQLSPLPEYMECATAGNLLKLLDHE